MPDSPSPPPPPAAFSFTSGGFDYPQATSSPPPPGQRAATSRVEGLARFLDRRQRERERRAVAGALENDASRGPLIARARRRQLLRESRAIPPHAERDPVLSALDPHWTLLGSQPYNPFAASSPSRRDRGRSPLSDTEGLSRQSKRRKLDHHHGRASEYDGFKYGYKGQVVVGRLKMSIESCDGGEHDKHNSERLYRAQNVLNNDKSVYCTEDSQCNLLLKHHGEAPFCLERIVIRAPDRGFTAPIQEGLIFVSMSGQELLENTPKYHIDYASRSPTASPSPVSSLPADDQILSLQEALEDPQVWERSRHAMEQQIERLRLRNRQRAEPNMLERRSRRARPYFTESNESNDLNESNNNPDYCPYHMEEDDVDADADVDAEPPTAVGVSAPTPPPFTITTSSDHSDSENDTTLTPSPAIMADRLRRESRWRSSSDEEDDNDPSSRLPLLRRARPIDDFTGFNERHWRSHRATAAIDPIRATRLRAPSRIEQKKRPGAIDGVDPKPLIKPLAQFFIERHRNKININFPVPISGKYVLLKLWSPTADGNIDIESIQCFGYSGPRFFPKVQMR